MLANETSAKEMALRTHFDLLSIGAVGQNDLTSRLGEVVTTPLFTEEVRQYALSKAAGTDENPFSQYGLLAGDIEGMSKVNPEHLENGNDPRLFYNIAAPSSVFICGSQGSGKSHSLSCLLENCLIPSGATCLPRPLTGVVFHYDTFISDTGGSPCEAAYLSSQEHVSVRVLCAPTNVGNIRRIYGKLPKVSIEELRLNESDLNTERMLNLMAVKSGASMPLYLSVINRILRELRIEQQSTNSSFNYAEFKKRVDAEALTDGQLAPLQQRLDTLESFMNQKHATAYSLKQNTRGAFRVAPPTAGAPKNNMHGNDWTPKVGQLTVVDLSCPCVTAEMACSLFGICLDLFLERELDIGRVVALDEAHKYMTESPERTRVIIATQEPTISPRLLDLCSITMVHRFTSPDWLNTLKQHLAGASIPGKAGNQAQERGDDAQKTPGINPLHLDVVNPTADLFSRIVHLKTGEALVFAPSAIIGINKGHAENNGVPPSETQTDHGGPERTIQLGNGVLKVRIRKRVTQDGGRSIMAS